MVETGRSPYLPWHRLAELGFEIVIYPVTTILAAGGGVRRVLGELADAGRADETSPDNLTLSEYHDLLSFYRYQQVESDYRSAVLASSADSVPGQGNLE
jgi:2-methylisocitrate lyase-like PEP mutase family enzyme